MPRYRLTATSGSARLFAALDHAIAMAGAALAEPERMPSPRPGAEAEESSLTLVIVAKDAATVRHILDGVKARLGREPKIRVQIED
jgi:hypothetical protein